MKKSKYFLLAKLSSIKTKIIMSFTVRLDKTHRIKYDNGSLI